MSGNLDGIAIRNLEDALATHTRTVLQDNWQVATGATTTTIPVELRNPSGKSVDVTGQTATDLQGAFCEFVSGNNLGVTRYVSAAANDGTLTLDSALPNVPAEGDLFVLIKGVIVNAVASENITQIGSQIIKPDDSGLARVPITDFSLEVNSATVAAGQIRSVSSALEVAYQDLTINGYYRCNGTALMNSLTIGAGGKVVIGAQGEIKLGAFL